MKISSGGGWLGHKIYLGILVLAVAGGGCAGTRNKVSQRNIPMPATEAVDASKDVMNEYGFDIQVIDREDGSFRLTGEHVDGQDVEVDIIPVNEGNTRVKLRVTNEPPRTSAKTILDDIDVRYE